jgi:hypothetical protein
MMLKLVLCWVLCSVGAQHTVPRAVTIAGHDIDMGHAHLTFVTTWVELVVILA